MKTTFLIFIITLLVESVELSIQTSNAKPTQCSADLPCSDDKFCVPLMSKCSGVERTNCYIDDHCPNDETCDNFIGYCLKQPECLNTRPYSFCRKDFCPCPDGYECKGSYPHQTCLPIAANAQLEAPLIIN